MEMLQYDFMQRAVIAIICIACASPILGLLLILRKQTLLADTLSHVSLVGVAIGVLLNLSPTWLTFLVVTIGAILMEYLRKWYPSYSDISISFLMSGGLALAVFLMHVSKGSAIKIEHYLFGSLVTITPIQLITLMILTIAIVGLYIIFKKPIYVLLFDEDIAKTEGLPVSIMSVTLTTVIGLAISVMMPISGTLLIAAILILPTAIAMRFTKQFTALLLLAGSISFCGMTTGLYLSYTYSTPPGATITLILTTILILSQLFRLLIKPVTQHISFPSSVNDHNKKGSI